MSDEQNPLQLWPALSPATEAALRESIERWGVLVPVARDQHGRTIDGHHRARIADELGCDYAVIVHKVEDDEEARELARTLNADRRHLTVEQRRDMVAHLREQGHSYRAIGEALGVSDFTARRDADELRDISQLDEPERITGQDGKRYPATKPRAPVIALSQREADAAQAALAELGDDAPDEAMSARQVTRLAKMQKRTTEHRQREREEVAEGDATVTKRDALSWLASLEDRSADLLLTDPPYMTDVDDIEVFAAWAPLALSKVKRTGRAYICVGAYPRELRAYIERLSDVPGWTLDMILPWTYRNTMGPSPKMTYKLNWQAVLYLYGDDAPPLDCPSMIEQFSVQDITAPDGRHGTRVHAWQKPAELAERFVRHATGPGQLVIDPFAGTGTMLASAARLGRFGRGCDISAEMLDICAGRGIRVV